MHDSTFINFCLFNYYKLQWLQPHNLVVNYCTEFTEHNMMQQSGTVAIFVGFTAGFKAIDIIHGIMIITLENVSIRILLAL